MNTTAGIIKKLKLEPHPEGGYYKEVYRSKGEINASSLSKEYDSKRNYSTSIYFLLTSANFSAFHRIKQDEIWHFYDGSPIVLHVINENGDHSKTIIGRDITAGQVPQYAVPGGCWFAAEVKKENAFSFVGCTVSPGFSFEDFELGSEKQLTNLFPHQKEIISKLTYQ